MAMIFFTNSIPAAVAIENGKDASGSAFVVPIKTQYSSTNMTQCSGVLVAATIVATAGH